MYIEKRVKGGLLMVRWTKIFLSTFILLLLLQFNHLSACSKDEYGYKIEVNKSTNKMYLYSNGEIVREYTISTGYRSDLTPEGTFFIVNRVVDPMWRHIKGGAKDNPLGPRWHGLRVNGDRGSIYGIHGTIEASSIGRFSTNGCIRMYNDEVMELFDIVREGTVVWIHRGKTDGKWRGEYPSDLLQD